MKEIPNFPGYFINTIGEIISFWKLAGGGYGKWESLTSINRKLI